MESRSKYNDLDECLETYASWYLYNQDRPTTLQACVDFLKAAIDGRLYLIHLLRDKVAALRDQYTNISDLDATIDKFATWYEANRETITDVLPLLTFLKKATDDTFHILDLMRQKLNSMQVKAQEDHLIYVLPGTRFDV